MRRKLASIDLGTHTARLLIAEWDEDTQDILPLARYRDYVHLGRCFHSGNGTLSLPSVRRVSDILRAFRHSIHEYGVETIVAGATGVVRSAQNRDEFLRLLREETGIKIRIISGEEEAVLTATAIHHAIDMGNKPHVMVDLGGGSTEFVVAQDDEWWARSVPIGASVLTERNLKTDPPARNDISQLRDVIRQSLMNGLDRRPSPRVFSMAGTGGTIVTLGALLQNVSLRDLNAQQVHGSKITRKSVEKLFAEMITLKREERISRYGLDADRAGVFPAGVLLTTEIMNFFSMDQLTVCFSDILEGLLWEYLADV
jgi:exopolyphosphatase / guanosine-5'-triphosphate,3'-diphosphate pyrophosphatase